jgi:hypothetical protein
MGDRIKPRQFLYHRIIDELADFMLNGHIKHHDNCSNTVNTLLLAMHRPCRGFFVDRHDRWYCSVRNDHRVIRYSFVPYTGRGENLLGEENMDHRQSHFIIQQESTSMTTSMSTSQIL